MGNVDARARAEMHLRRAAVEPGNAVRPQPRQQVCVVAVAAERLRISLYELAVQVRYDRDLILAAYGGKDGPDLSVGKGCVEIRSPVLCSRAYPSVVGYSTGTSPVTSMSRRMACSCTAGATPGAANDGDSTATLSPGRAFGGCTRSGSMCSFDQLHRSLTSLFSPPQTASASAPASNDRPSSSVWESEVECVGISGDRHRRRTSGPGPTATR